MQIIDPPENLCTSAGTGEETAPVRFSVPGLDRKTILLPLMPLDLGTTKLTVRVRTQLGGDEIEQEIRVVVMILLLQTIYLCYFYEVRNVIG